LREAWALTAADVSQLLAVASGGTEQTIIDMSRRCPWAKGKAAAETVMKLHTELTKPTVLGCEPKSSNEYDVSSMKPNEEAKQLERFGKAMDMVNANTARLRIKHLLRSRASAGSEADAVAAAAGPEGAAQEELSAAAPAPASAANGDEAETEPPIVQRSETAKVEAEMFAERTRALLVRYCWMWIVRNPVPENVDPHSILFHYGYLQGMEGVALRLIMMQDEFSPPPGRDEAGAFNLEERMRILNLNDDIALLVFTALADGPCELLFHDQTEGVKIIASYFANVINQWPPRKKWILNLRSSGIIVDAGPLALVPGLNIDENRKLIAQLFLTQYAQSLGAEFSTLRDFVDEVNNLLLDENKEKTKAFFHVFNGRFYKLIMALLSDSEGLEKARSSLPPRDLNSEASESARALEQLFTGARKDASAGKAIVCGLFGC